MNSNVSSHLKFPRSKRHRPRALSEFIPLFLIGEDGDLALPFSKQMLLSRLEDFQSSLRVDLSGYDAAEDEICALFDEFKAKIIEILRRQNG